MTTSELLFSLLSNDAPVAALILIDGIYQIYPGVAPEDSVTPRITYQVISSVPYNLLKGGHQGQKARVQVTAWAPTRSVADDLGTKSKTALEAGGYILDSEEDRDPEAQLDFVRFDWSVIVD